MGDINISVCVVLIFATFEIRCCLIRELRYHFQLYISTCILKFYINGEIFKSVALAVLERVKTLSVALEVSLSIMYVSREATFSLTSLSFSKNE